MTEIMLIPSSAVGTPNRFPAQAMANVQIAVTNAGLLHDASLLHDAGVVAVVGGPSHGRAATFEQVSMWALPAVRHWALWIAAISTVDEPTAFQRISVTSTAGGEGETHRAAADDDDSWPPPWFGAIQSDRPDTAARTEEILRAEFGQNDHR